MKQVLDEILREMEVVREDFQNRKDPPDYVIKLWENIVAKYAGYRDRTEWKHLQPEPKNSELA
jgi:hypothetical protein